jgi:general secretion pathway protein D
MVKDQATVAIGGLIRDVDNETVNKVPFLGDIPLLGVLFRSTGTIKTKQNLVLMLTPYIIESDADLKKIRERKLAEREELLKLFGRRDIAYIKTVNFDRKSGLLDRMKQQIYDAKTDLKAREDALKAFQNDGPQYQILGDDGEPIQREQLEDGGVRFDPEAE